MGDKRSPSEQQSPLRDGSNGERGTGGRRSRAWSVYLLLGILAAFGFFLLSGILEGFMYDLIYDFVGLSAVAAILIGARMNRPESLLPWYLFAFGQLMFVAGDVTLNYYENVLHVEAPFPSISDALWLTGYPLLVAGLLMLIRRRAPGRDWASLIDATIIAVSMGVVSWVFLMSHYADDPTLSVLDQVISMSYPLMDVVLVAVVARLAVAPGARTSAYSLLTLSLLFLLVADAVYSKMLLDGTYYTGSLPDLGFLLSYVFWAAAALHPKMDTLSEPTPERGVKLTWLRLVLLAAAAISPPTIRAIQLVRDIPVDRPVIVGGSMALSLLVIARMAVFVRQHEHSIAREKILRRAGADLVAAPDRGSIYEATLRTVLELAGRVPGIRASVAVGTAEEMTFVASAGDHAEDARGERITLSNLPNDVRSGFVGQSAAKIEHADLESVQGALGSTPKTRTIYVNPLLAQDDARIVLVTAAGDRTPFVVPLTMRVFARILAARLPSPRTLPG